LQFEAGTTRLSLRLEGSETFDITGLDGALAPRARMACTITRADGSRERIMLLARIDSKAEVKYYQHGGIVKYALRRRLVPPAATVQAVSH
jgi:aconitate hydratase